VNSIRKVLIPNGEDASDLRAFVKGCFYPKWGKPRSLISLPQSAHFPAACWSSWGIVFCLVTAIRTRRRSIVGVAFQVVVMNTESLNLE